MSNQGKINFNTGEVSSKIDVRTDVEKYSGGCRRSENMIPSIYGTSTRRPGTKFVASDGTLASIFSAIMAWENDILCYENTVVVTDFDNSIQNVICYENDSVSHENIVLVDGDILSFISRILCHENSVLFYENDSVIL